MRTLLLAISLFVATPCSGIAAVLSGPIINPANGHHYYLLDQAHWTESQAEARSLGGSLVTINDAAEQQWLVDTFGPIDSEWSPNSFWIGLNDARIEGTFRWASGEPVTYTNWLTGEPNGIAGGGEDYVYIGRHAGGQWNDHVNDGVGFSPEQPQPRAVVEVVIPEPTTLALSCFACGMIGLGRRPRPRASLS